MRVCLSGLYKKVDPERIHVAVYVRLNLNSTHMPKVPKSNKKAHLHCVICILVCEF